MCLSVEYYSGRVIVKCLEAKHPPWTPVLKKTSWEVKIDKLRKSPIACERKYHIIILFHLICIMKSIYIYV